MNIPSFLQKQFINRVSGYLPRFSWESPVSCNFRCPICGDSKKSKTKRRGYIYEARGNWWYKCQNCGHADYFTNYLKEFHRALYNELIIDAIRSNAPNPQAAQPNKVSEPTKVATLDISGLVPVRESDVALSYIKKRMIPEHQWGKLYYTDDFRRVVMNILSDMGADIDAAEKIQPKPAILIPFFINKELSFLQARYLEGDFRYQTARFSDITKCFGVDEVDDSEDIYVFEGPIKSLFIDNSIATADASLERAVDYFPKEKLVLVFDNEPRAEIGVRKIEKAINAGFRVVIFPEYIKQKDVDDMIIDGIPVNDNISSWVYSGLKAKMMLKQWKRI